MFIKLTIYDSYGGDGIYFDKKVFSSESYQDLKTALVDYWLDLIECGFLSPSKDNEYDLIHTESGTVVEGSLMAYKSSSDADNDVNAIPFQTSQFFKQASKDIISGTCWDDVSDRLDDDVLGYWGINDVMRNPSEELTNSYDDEFFTALFDVYKAATIASR